MLILLIAHPGVAEIREQVTTRYQRHGVDRSYTFDIVVRMRDGWVEAIAVKGKEEELAADDTCGTLRAIHAQHGARFANAYRAITYEKLDPIALKNAELILRCGGDRDIEGQTQVREALADLPATVTPREIGDATKLGRRGIRAAFALVQAGILMPPPGQELDPDLPLENRASATGNYAP
ncbi:hypothetical protein [Bosea sp. ASV33]|uniref:hypothetical protein n=1 Tax=Bosea sp. ASV33 TaxID=2795106 RepID=UPI0018ECFFE1|nr:hypothetical protein [Bosea sp. ASV33]